TRTHMKCVSAMTDAPRAHQDKSPQTIQSRAVPHARCTDDRADASSRGREHPSRERTMWRARFAAASLAVIIATSAALEFARAQDELKIAVGGGGIGETFLTDGAYKASLLQQPYLPRGNCD